jgi:hypothetical protein
MILCDNRTIFSLLILIPGLSHWLQSLPQNQLAIARQLRFHFFEHFLIGDASAAHGILMLD